MASWIEKTNLAAPKSASRTSYAWIVHLCPNCGVHADSRWTRRCGSCETHLVYCDACERLSELVWHTHVDSRQTVATCTHCDSDIGRTAHILKSSIYRDYAYAFKFVNETSVPYPMYLRGQFPFGQVLQDVGDHINNFRFRDDDSQLARMMGTDWGTARAYRVRCDDEAGKPFECVALSHESGLEVFLVATGGFVGLGVAQFSLKAVLGVIQGRINEWWKSRRSDHPASEIAQLDKITGTIAVRTPHWEITLDGQFSPEERAQVLDHISSILEPSPEIASFVVGLGDQRLETKVVEATNAIVRRT